MSDPHACNPIGNEQGGYFTTLLDSQTALLTYEHDLHRFEAMYGTAVAELDRLTGRTFDAGLAAGMEN